MKFVFLAIVSSLIVQVTQAKEALKSDSAILRIYFKDAANDTLQLFVYTNYFSKKEADTRLFATVKNDTSVFVIKDINSPVYFTLTKKTTDHHPWKTMLSLYLVEPGDNVLLRLEKFGYPWESYKLAVKGVGSGKYSLRNELDSLMSSRVANDSKILNANGTLNTNTFFDKCWNEGQRKFNKYQGRITKQVVDLLKIDLFSQCEIGRLTAIHSDLDLNDTVAMRRIRGEYFGFSGRRESALVAGMKKKSAQYPRYLIDKLAMGRYKRGNGRRMSTSNIEKVFTELIGKFKGELRDRLITFFLFDIAYSEVQDVYLTKALKSVQTDYCLDLLNQYILNNSVGKPAYNFSLPDTTGRLVNLKDFRNQVLFIDFWYTGCPGCAGYYKKVVSEVKKHFKGNASISFVSISIDVSREQWMSGIYSGLYTSPDITNLYTAGEGSDHEIIHSYRVTGYPRPVLIDKHGNIFSNNVNELRFGGPEKLIETINRALATK